MSKGGGQGSFQQMQEPGMGMDMGGFGGGGPQPAMPFQQPVTPVGNSQDFSSGIGGKGGQLAPQNQGPGSYMGNEPVPQRATNIQTQGPESMPTPGMPLMSNDSERFNRIYDFLPQRQPQPITYANETTDRMMRENPPQRIQPVTGGPVAPPFTPVLRSEVLPFSVMDGGNAFGSGQGTSAPSGRTNLSEAFNQNQERFDDFIRQANEMRQDRYSPPRATPRFSDEEHSRALTQAREILGTPSGGQRQPAKNNEPRLTAGIKPQPSDRVYAGGTPNFDERTGQYRQQPFMPRSYNDGRMGYRSPPQYGGYRSPPRPPVYGQQRFPSPYGQPSIPSRNTQFNMPFMPQSYGRMNPYADQFGGYGVPSNMFSFAQPQYQPYAPPTYAPAPAYTPPPPVMQLPPGTGMPTFYGGGSQGPATIGGGIGGFGRYNLGLAGSQLR